MSMSSHAMASSGANRDRERSATTLSRIEQDDSSLTKLLLRNTDRRFQEPEAWGLYCPTNAADLASLGAAVGNNTNLRILVVYDGATLEEMAIGNGRFFEGLRQNTSITNLMLTQCHLSGELENGMMNNINLDRIYLHRCALDVGGLGVLTSALARSTEVTGMSIESCNIEENILVTIIQLCSLLRQLRVLHLKDHAFGRAGCEAIATVLKHPNSNLAWLDLSGSDGIDDSCATILAHALKSNSRLWTLDLAGCAITTSGLNAFSELLCDSSSVETTFRSNHALSNLGDVASPANLSSLLGLNRGPDKKLVARQKILQTHNHFEMDLFLNWDLDMPRLWDLRVLPIATGWFDKAKEYIEKNDSVVDSGNIDSRKLSAMYQFIRAFPAMLEDGGNAGNA